MKSNHTDFNEIASGYGEVITNTKQHITLPLFQKILGEVNGKKVADLGCGEGFFTRIIAKEKPSFLIGMDIASKLIEIAIQREQQEKRGILYQCQDIRSLDKKECFDLVTAVYLLNFAETREDLLLMLKSIYNTLTENGKFCAIIPHTKIKPTAGFELGRKIISASNKNHFQDGDIVHYEIESEKEKRSLKNSNFSNHIIILILKLRLFQILFRTLHIRKSIMQSSQNINIKYHYWSKETYESCLREAGFSKIKWKEPTISTEAITLFGKEYWSSYQENPSSIGVVCWKE